MWICGRGNLPGNYILGIWVGGRLYYQVENNVPLGLWTPADLYGMRTTREWVRVWGNFCEEFAYTIYESNCKYIELFA